MLEANDVILFSCLTTGNRIVAYLLATTRLWWCTCFVFQFVDVLPYNDHDNNNNNNILTLSYVRVG